MGDNLVNIQGNQMFVSCEGFLEKVCALQVNTITIIITIYKSSEIFSNLLPRRRKYQNLLTQSNFNLQELILCEKFSLMGKIIFIV
jgi:hypothetical protein